MTHYPIGNTQRNDKSVRSPAIPYVIGLLKIVLTVLVASTAASHAANCPRAGTLGTSRVLAVDPAATPRVGLKSFPQTLALADREVVLTFDDGPWPSTTSRILTVLAQECVRATFFLIGRNAAAHPALVRRIAAEGHTIGHHSFSHPNLKYLRPAAAEADIDKGIAADEIALHGAATTTPRTPFFRFPYFESTPHLLDRLQSRGIGVFGADLWASDWEPMTVQAQLKLLTDRLNAAGKGIILLHDPKAQTAAMMPAFLRYLRDNQFRVVHLVPAPRGLAGVP